MEKRGIWHRMLRKARMDMTGGVGNGGSHDDVKSTFCGETGTWTDDVDLRR